MICVLMGVSGCGKTTIGQLLAAELQCPFLDADDFHPASNLAKMKQGIPLTDTDRWPWLDAIRTAAVAQVTERRKVVMACSALKQEYRSRLDPRSSNHPGNFRANSPIHFVHLQGEFALIESRLKSRRHFMPPSLLASQFADLEPPTDALVVEINQTPEQIVHAIRRALAL